MDIFETMDKSPTLYNEQYQEYYHSKSGAVEEAVEKYVRPCKIEELAKKGRLKVLDVGFGLGYNAIAAIDYAISSNENCEIVVISLEKDESVLGEAKKLKPGLKHFFILEKLEKDPKTNSYSYEEKNFYLRIRIGDAVNVIKTISDKFDAVFLDGFSPSKNPELWSPEFIKEVSRRMKPGAILSTYSYAKKVRDTLGESGLEVRDGPVIGRRSPCTLAIKP